MYMIKLTTTINKSNNEKISNGTYPICEMKEDKTSSCNGLNKNIPVSYG